MSHNLLVGRPTSSYLQASFSSQTFPYGWGTVLIDSPSVNTSGLTISSSVFTATVAGTYLIWASIYISSDTSLSWLAIAKNGTTPTRIGMPGQSGWIIDMLEEVQLEVGDNFRIVGFSFGGATIATLASLTVARLL